MNDYIKKLLTKPSVEAAKNPDEIDFLNEKEGNDNPILLHSPNEKEHRSPEEEEIASLSKRGYKLLHDGLYDDAIICFQKILGLEPKNAYALVGIGDAERKLKNLSSAMKYYEIVLEDNNRNNFALFGMADCYKAMSQYSKAIALWERFYMTEPNNITVLTSLADSYRKINDFSHSKKYYEKVLALDSSNSYALIGLARLYFSEKDYDTAIYYLNSILSTTTDLKTKIRVLTSMGNCYRKMKTFNLAIDYFKKALKIEPENFYALYGMADCCRGLGRNEESIHYWNAILKNDPNNKIILTRLGDAYRICKQYDKAMPYYKKALNIDYDMYAVLGIALVYKEMKLYNEALNKLNQLRMQKPRHFRAYVEMADCYLCIGQKDNAEAILLSYLKMGMTNPMVESKLRAIRNS